MIAFFRMCFETRDGELCMFNILLLLQNGRTLEMLGMDISIGIAKDSLSNL